MFPLGKSTRFQMDSSAHGREEGFDNLIDALPASRQALNCH